MNGAALLQDEDDDDWDEDEYDDDEAQDREDGNDRDNDEDDEGDDDEGEDDDDEEDVEGLDVHELLEELTEELHEMDSEFTEEIDDIREDLREGFAEAPPVVQKALSQLNIGQIVRQSLRDAPESARMLVREVDPAGIVEKLTRNADWHEVDCDDDELDELQEKLKAKLTGSIEQLVERVNREIRQAREEVAQLGELPASA